MQSRTFWGAGQAQAGRVLPGGAAVALQPQARVVGVRHPAAHAVHALAALDARRLRLLHVPAAVVVSQKADHGNAVMPAEQLSTMTAITLAS